MRSHRRHQRLIAQLRAIHPHPPAKSKQTEHTLHRFESHPASSSKVLRKIGMYVIIGFKIGSPRLILALPTRAKANMFNSEFGVNASVREEIEEIPPYSRTIKTGCVRVRIDRRQGRPVWKLRSPVTAKHPPLLGGQDGAFPSTGWRRFEQR